MSCSARRRLQALLTANQPVPDQPLEIAVIGAGKRSRTIYGPLWPALKPWCEVVAVCDPQATNGGPFAEDLGVPNYDSLRKLVRDRPMEAAIVITPIPSHHSISVHLSRHGIHNHTETTWASMVCQAQDMIRTARKHGTVVRVAENFFRHPIDRFAATVRDHGYLGRIGRIVSHATHTGYHDNSRWLVFAGCNPSWVQGIEHTIAHEPFFSSPERRHERETYKARHFEFPNGLLVSDQSANIKGFLGRHPRDGYTEWQGTRGALVHRAPGARWGNETTELRRVSDARLATAQEDGGVFANGGVADVLTPVRRIEDEKGRWLGDAADTPLGRIAHVSRLGCFAGLGGQSHGRDWYGLPVMEHVIDFALAVRGLRESEFTAEDALMSQMMEVGARESARQEGRRVGLPLEGGLESDAVEREKQRRAFGVDPLDVDAMLSISFPKP